MTKIDIRPATTEDIPLIREMAAIVFPATYREILSPEQLDYMMEWMYSEQSLIRQMSEGHRFFIASTKPKDSSMTAGTPCGYMSIEGFHLQKLYVLPGHQGHGIGKALFNHAVREATQKAKGTIANSSERPRLELNVNRNNSAVGFYTRQGMKILRQRDFPIGGGFYMNDYIMGLDLL